MVALMASGVWAWAGLSQSRPLRTMRQERGIGCSSGGLAGCTVWLYGRRPPEGKRLAFLPSPLGGEGRRRMSPLAPVLGGEGGLDFRSLEDFGSLGRSLPLTPDPSPPRGEGRRNPGRRLTAPSSSRRGGST